MTEQNNDQYSSAPAWEPATSRSFWIILSMATLLLVVVFWSVVPFLFFALVIAYLTMPIVNFFDRRLFGGKRRAAAIGLTFLLTVVLIVVAIIAFIPPIIQQAQAVLSSLPVTLENLLDTPIRVGGEADDTPFVPRDWLAQSEFGASALAFVDDLYRESAGGNVSVFGFIAGSLSRLRFDTFGFVTNAVRDMLNTIFFVLVLVYLWSDWENIIESFLQLAPEAFQPDWRRLVYELGQIWNNYLRGELIIAAVMGTLAWALAFFAGLPNPLFIGFMVGLLEFIPNIGPGLAAGVLVSTALVNTSANFPGLSGVPLALIVLVVWVALLQFQGGFPTPRVLGNSLRLHPIVVILAVMWGASLGGVIGIIIAGPIVATIRLIMQYIYGRLTNRPAFPPMAEPRPRVRWLTRLRQMLPGSSDMQGENT